MHRIQLWWRDSSIRSKSIVLFGVVLVVMWALVGMAALQLQSFSRSSNLIMEDYQRISGFLTAFSEENRCLEELIRPTHVANALETYLNSAWETDRYLTELQPDLEGDLRRDYRYKRSMNNAMEYYRSAQTDFLEMLSAGESYITEYLSLKTQSAYIDGYARALLNSRIAQGNEQYQRMQTQSLHYNELFLVFVALSTVILALALMLFSSSILSPLRALALSADAIRSGDYDMPPLMPRGQDELGRAAASFNLMQTQVRSTIHALEKEKEMEKSLRRQEAEAARMQRALEEGRFAQLQSQINPHFLFNTLSTISAVAQEEHAPLSEDLIVRLASFFRYSLESDEKTVNLARELALLRDYMELQETRFGSRIRMELRAQPSCEDCVVPKFILQPLVENAIVHGFQNARSGCIRVRAWRGRRGVCISVTDNGSGFSPNALRREEPGRRSVGLANIAQRMRMSGGRLDLFSRPGLGTCARIIVEEGLDV